MLKYLLLALLLPATAYAQPTPCEAEPIPLADGAFKVALTPDPTTAWQPPGGEVRFSLKGTDIPADDMKLWVCFRWHGILKPMPWHRTPPTRVLPVNGNQVDLSVLVPAELLPEWPKWFHNFGAGREVEYTGFGLVPLADMHIVATSEKAAWHRIDTVVQVGITHRWFALIPASLATLVAWLIFNAWGRARGIQGDLILRIICSPNGTASLSQFQIMLWTLVVASSTIYVMALSGSLIDIPATMLGLLGISGISTLGAKLSAGVGTPSPNPPDPTPQTPRWSDLVIAGGGSNEIDVTRLQMLLFTLIAAVFVAMKVFDQSQIPEIPSGMLSLMGLSNGVYLAAKFVPSPRT